MKKPHNANFNINDKNNLRSDNRIIPKVVSSLKEGVSLPMDTPSDMGKEKVKSGLECPIGDNSRNKFVSLSNTLFEDEYEVVQAPLINDPPNIPGECQSVQTNPLFFDQGRVLNSSHQPRLNAQQISLASIKEKADLLRNATLVPSELRLSNSLPSIMNSMVEGSSDKQIVPFGSDGLVSSNAKQFIEVVSKKMRKKRKTFDRQSLSNDNSKKGNEVPECFNRLCKNQKPSSK